MQSNICHLPRSDRLIRAERLCQWLLSVPKMSPLAPHRRLDYYIRGWDVLGKIDHFVQTGDFERATANCPAYSGAELRACLDYLDRLDASDSAQRPAKCTTTPVITSSTQPKSRRAAKQPPARPKKLSLVA